MSQGHLNFFEQHPGSPWTLAGHEAVRREASRHLSQEERLACALEAIAAHGNTPLTVAWYERWLPVRLREYGIQTTTQYSLSCLLMEHALRLASSKEE